MVSDAAATKAPIAKVADRVSGVFVPTVIAIARRDHRRLAALRPELSAIALARGISVLVISCPCALGLATPVAIMVGNGMGAEERHPVQDRRFARRNRQEREIVALDKTGTITQGEPQVTDVLPAAGHDARTRLSALAARARTAQRASPRPRR